MSGDTSAAGVTTGEFIIETRGLTKRYGGLIAVDNVSLAVPRGEVFGIIGPNGAGKSTLVGLISGASKPSSGTILLDGVDISNLPASERARRGIGRTYQIPRPFLDMSVAENLEVALYSVNPFIPAGQAREEVKATLARTGLARETDLVARNLPLLRRKRLEVARALMLKPRLLLLDEVGAELVDAEISELIDLIHSIGDGTTSIVIIEHVIRIVRECCRQLAVLHVGSKFTEGPTAAALADKDVAAIYLGTAHGDDRSTAPRPSVPARAAIPASSQSEILLRLADVTAGYGQARVLNGVGLDVSIGEAVAILGTNGAGKTTLANTISGGIHPTGGSIHFAGKDITAMPSHQRARFGIAHCMEGRRIFQTLSVEENLLIAMRVAAKSERKRRLDKIYELFPILAERAKSPGTSLSGGQQQMLAIGRALMSDPRLIIFDEISLGLAPVIMERLYETLRQLNAAGLAMIVVEQDVQRALDLAHRAYVLDRGRIAMSGPSTIVSSDQRLKTLYIGN